MKRWLKTYGVLLLILAALISWGVLLYFVPPDALVDKIGVENSYLAAFLIAAFAGFSSFTGTSFYAAIIALSNGGANVLILGLVGGIGLFISDTIFYFVASKGRNIVADRWKKLFEKIKDRMERLPSWLVYAGVYVYAGFGPLPNDILLAALAVSAFSYKRFAIFLLAGDITLTLILSYFSN